MNNKILVNYQPIKEKMIHKSRIIKNEFISL